MAEEQPTTSVASSDEDFAASLEAPRAAETQPGEDIAQPTEPASEAKRRRIGLIWPLALMILFIVLLLLATCGAFDGLGNMTGGDKTVESVEGLEPQPGYVAVWVKSGYQNKTVVARYGFKSFTDLGGGRIVVKVGSGKEDAAIEAFANDDEVNDAGYVYEQLPASVLATGAP